jgi:segregation and condensation protein B
MSHELDPKVGRWYRRLDDEQLFKVVDIDEDDGLIEIKTVDGDTEELDSTEWVELDLEAAEQPEDYVDPDEAEDEDDEVAEDEEEDEKPKRGSARDDWDDDDEDDDWDDDEDDDDDDYDSDR